MKAKTTTTAKFKTSCFLSSATMIIMAALNGAAAQERNFDIRSGDLAKALEEFRAQSGRNVLYNNELVSGKPAKSIKGAYTDERALSILLADNDLEFKQGANDTMLIRASTQVQAIDSDDDDAASSGDDDVGLDADEVIVTGTNIRGVTNPTVPVLTFDKEDIDLSGAATVDDFLRTIPQNFASETQLTAESGNPFDSGNNRTQGTVVDLRGLGAGSTLTLLNGRRMAFAGDGASTDVNAIPLAAIERIEVLTDGATALYGSDAVGGVINFITRKDYEGFDINARYGTVTEGSREDFSVGGAGGFNWGSGNFFAGVNYQEEKPLLVEERDFVDTSLTREGATFGSDTERFGVSGSINQEIGSRIRFGVNGFFSNTTAESLSITDGLPILNISEQSTVSINSSIEYDLTSNITASFFFDFGQNKVDRTDTDIDTGVSGGDEFNNDLLAYEGRLSGQLFTLPGGDLSFSIGGMYREEDFQNFDEGALFLEAERNIIAAYGELLIPIFGEANALPFIQKLELSVAGRYEDYSDVGNSFDPKIGVYWEVNDDLSLRASYSEAFRAPDLISLNAEQLAIIFTLPEFFFTAISPDEPAGADFFGSPAFVVLQTAGGNPNLTPERAKTWSAGFSYEPSFVNGLSLEGNYFRVDYTDRIEFGLAFLAIQDPNFTSLANVSPDVNAIQTIFDRGSAGELVLFDSVGVAPGEVQVVLPPDFVNVSERKVSGFDLTLDYSLDTDLGQFSVGANASYLIDFIGRAIDTAPASEQINILYRPVDFRLRGNLSWSKGGFTAFTAINYVDGYRDNIDSSIANGIDAWTTIDLSLAYDTGNRFGNVLADNVRFGFSVTNLFDNDPPFALTPFGLNFDTSNANPWGRQINFTISKRF